MKRIVSIIVVSLAAFGSFSLGWMTYYFWFIR